MNLLQFKTFLTMKKLFKTCISVVAIGGIAFFAACKKEATSTLETVPADLKTAADLTYVAEYENYQVPVAQVKTKIREVQTKLNNSALETRSAEMVPIAEAVWYIEALANASEGHATWQYQQLNVKNHYISLLTVVQNGQKQVSLSEIASKYAEAVQFIQQDEASLSYPQANKETVFTNVSPMTDSNGDTFLEVAVGIGIDPTCPGCAPMNAPVITCEETTNCWRAGFDLGTCNTPVSGPTSGIDATDVIEGFINNVSLRGCPMRRPIEDVFVSSPIGGHFANLVRSPLYQYNSQRNRADNTPDGYRDFLLFRTSSSTTRGYNDCLSVPDMNFYFYGAVSIIRTQMLVDYPGKFVAYCDMNYDVLTNGTTNVSHNLSFWVGDFIP